MSQLDLLILLHNLNFRLKGVYLSLLVVSSRATILFIVFNCLLGGINHLPLVDILLKDRIELLLRTHIALVDFPVLRRERVFNFYGKAWLENVLQATEWTSNTLRRRSILDLIHGTRTTHAESSLRRGSRDALALSLVRHASWLLEISEIRPELLIHGSVKIRVELVISNRPLSFDPYVSSYVTLDLISRDGLIVDSLDDVEVSVPNSSNLTLDLIVQLIEVALKRHLMAVDHGIVVYSGQFIAESRVCSLESFNLLSSLYFVNSLLQLFLFIFVHSRQKAISFLVLFALLLSLLSCLLLRLDIILDRVVQVILGELLVSIASEHLVEFIFEVCLVIELVAESSGELRHLLGDLPLNGFCIRVDNCKVGHLVSVIQIYYN